MLSLLVCLAGLACPAFGQEGDSALLDLPYAAGFPLGTNDPGQDVVEPLTAYIVERAGTLTTPDGETLLPPGTVLDRLTFDPAGIAHLALTFQAGKGPASLPESHVAAIDTVFRRTLSQTRELAGLDIQVREANAPGGYRSLGSLIPQLAPAPQEQFASDVPAVSNVAEAAPALLGGPVTNADGQPAGALSGVIVFCTAGHGWTAGTSSWSLQRGVTNSMIEDYGNLEQLNYFVHYLYNAGATVVPFRPVGYQHTEIVLDNDDPGVTYTGSWTNSTETKYYENQVTSSGVSYRFASASANETATARFTPALPAADFYPVYCWAKHGNNRVPQLYRIHHAGGTAQVTIDHRLVGNGWVWLGNYYFDAGSAGWVEISNQSSVAGVVIADAVRFGNGMGSVPRTNANQVSGYPRDEECHRYWAHNELGNNAVGFTAADIWDSSDTDSNDNVSAAARWAREMNLTTANNDRWRRIYVEFHSNASGGTAKGTVALYNTGNFTTNQLALATLMGEKVEADMLALDGGFEYAWGPRNPNTYHASFDYGAINSAANGNEFDATILEVAFHDNVEDAANMRSAKVRDALGRSTAQSVIQFLADATLFPGTQIPASYLPDPPEHVRATHDGNGNVVLSWTPGPSRPAASASGDPATGYKIYRSANGYAFGNAVTVGAVTTATLTDVPADATTYLRVAATNAGGESMPSSVLAVRRFEHGRSRVLIVDGFDRVSRQQNIVQSNYAGTHDRPIPRRVNSFDYIVQHAGSLAAAGLTFDSCHNEAVTDGTVALTEYTAVVWVLGEESSADNTFNAAEQSLVTAYLDAGGRLFATGAEIAYELDSLNAGRSFYENTLRGNYVGDSAGTYIVNGAGGILLDVGTFDFNPGNGAPYDAATADRITPGSGAAAILTYSGGSGGTAGIQYDSGIYKVVLFGFPFETITSETARNVIMQRVMDYFGVLSSSCWPQPDFDCDGDVDQSDFGHLQLCLTGSGEPQPDPDCRNARLDFDADVDPVDLLLFRNCMSGEGVPASPTCLTD